MPPPPVFQNVSLSEEAFIGIEAKFRELMGFIKANPVYDQADGEDLMIVAPNGGVVSGDVSEIAPFLKLAATNDNVVEVGYKKAGFDGLELQWRKSGDEMWQFADKMTESQLEFKPPDAQPGAPEKFEFRGVYLKKNKRVGQWSPTYAATVG